MDIEGKVHCHKSIRNYLLKLGLYRILKEDGVAKSYAVYVDEGVSFGSEKILLALSIYTD